MSTERPKVATPVVGVLAYDKSNRIFLVQSSGKWGDLWIVPGGHIEYGEKMEETVLREMKEETGIDVFEPELIEVQESIFEKKFHDNTRHFIFLDFIVKADSSKPIKINDESKKYVWIEADKALKELNLNESTRKFIEKFIFKKMIS